MARAPQSAKAFVCGGVLSLLALAWSFGASAYQLEEAIVGWLLFSAAFLLLTALVLVGVAGFLLIAQMTKWAVQQMRALLEAASSSSPVHTKSLR